MNQTKKIILASGNVGKLKEFKDAFENLNLELSAQPKTAEYEVAETGTTFVENATIKARHASRLSGLPALADDSGLIVPALNGQPGVYSARYAGTGASDLDNLNLLLENMRGIENRSAHFFCCLVYMRHHQDPDPIIAKGIWQGSIANEALGGGGFGYDPIFYLASHQCTAAELPKSIKQQVSHRAQAIQQIEPLLAATLQA
ncbi:RdgB/HAM1 family non-canonical purine NTP pyrophosphatase [Marinicella sp. S1101]|uniref:RdgB/HAM1 family non-canonical purine NTP pyrophosphatase n=1 Tax=Marinicella marina TaxID=2996016 RepID=UPI002260B841|nr:RdgB/HAM1 family non-canonical purine NTP pyrophosphatase [Marinicella marina]MCX7552493.1 RdgB/HAM1 family non-canonical purine NTP pyrophosphatase [Marinicella marina]MDJ1139369.1 RdgB/HAM1 family non-canonical purine NTP pyrophosphatase [Marinicella marina]